MWKVTWTTVGLVALSLLLCGSNELLAQTGTATGTGGTVSSVSAGRLVLLDEEGPSFTVAVGDRTRVLRDGKRITARQLEKGTRVRATVDMLGGSSQAMEIVALPGAR